MKFILFLCIFFNLNLCYATEPTDEEDIDDVFNDTTPDPFEKWNKIMFEFNNSLDEKILQRILPNNKETLLSKVSRNFSFNFFEPSRMINYTLQANFHNFATSLSRFIINTTFGFFGFSDVANKLGIEKKDTNFNATLKKWGVPSGPYVVLPVLGPSSLRYVMSLIVDWPISSISKKVARVNNLTYYGLTCLNLLSKRSAYGDMIQHVSATTTDKYNTFKQITMSMEK